MGRCSFFERQGATYLEVVGGGLYKAQDRDEIIFENDDWCLVARKPHHRRDGNVWANCRLLRLYSGVRCFQFGVNVRDKRPSDNIGSRTLNEAHPGFVDWVVKSVVKWIGGHAVTQPPKSMPPLAANSKRIRASFMPPSPEPASKEEERLIVDLVRDRQSGASPLSQRRQTRPLRYAGDVAEELLGIAEPVVFEAIQKMLMFGILEDVMVDPRTKMRGLRVNEANYTQYFEREKADV